jgi:hypothetical protein
MHCHSPSPSRFPAGRSRGLILFIFATNVWPSLPTASLQENARLPFAYAAGSTHNFLRTLKVQNRWPGACSKWTYNQSIIKKPPALAHPHFNIPPSIASTSFTGSKVLRSSARVKAAKQKDKEKGKDREPLNRLRHPLQHFLWTLFLLALPDPLNHLNPSALVKLT